MLTPHELTNIKGSVVGTLHYISVVTFHFPPHSFHPGVIIVLLLILTKANSPIYYFPASSQIAK